MLRRLFTPTLNVLSIRRSGALEITTRRAAAMDRRTRTHRPASPSLPHPSAHARAHLPAPPALRRRWTMKMELAALSPLRALYYPTITFTVCRGCP